MLWLFPHLFLTMKFYNFLNCLLENKGIERNTFKSLVERESLFTSTIIVLQLETSPMKADMSDNDLNVSGE